MDIVIGGIYEHYKGHRYVVLAVGRHSEREEERMVVYEGLYDSEEFGNHPVWVRPYELFVDTVEVDGEVRPRFQYVGMENEVSESGLA